MDKCLGNKMSELLSNLEGNDGLIVQVKRKRREREREREFGIVGMSRGAFLLETP